MSNEKSTGTFASSKDLVSSRRINIQKVQNVLLIWLDNNIDENDVDCQNTITQLQYVVNTIKTFTDTNQCVDFLTDICDEKVCLIISEALCQNIVPLIHDAPQLHTIFIFCRNKTQDEQWIKNWSKISGVFTEVSRICELLKRSARQCEQNAMPISFITTEGDMSEKKLDQLDPLFMYTLIVKEILLTIKFDRNHIKEFLDHCREQFAENNRQLDNITKFETRYYDETPIWWYTNECFLYSMLNRCLRLMDVDIILKMGFFIDDLHRYIEQLHQEQFGDRRSGTTFTVYRGQGLSKTDFEQMLKTKGGLMSFNNFLSTSKDYDVSFLFAESNQSNPDQVGILFVLIIDPSISSVPFASINHMSNYQVEDEVLFSMHTIFRIDAITPIDRGNRLFQVKLTLTSDNDKDFRALTDRIREETYPDKTGWHRLGLVLWKMGQSRKAQPVYEVILRQTTKESEKASIYLHLGLVKKDQGDYTDAITCYEKALEIYKKTLPLTDLNFAACYNNIGEAYRSMGDYPKALSYYEKDLRISRLVLPPNHPDLSISYNNIGFVYDAMADYPKALSYFERALAIKQQSLPPNHPDLGASYDNIGLVYKAIGDYSKALSYFVKALAIRQQSLPPNHPDLAKSYTAHGMVYDGMRKYSEAIVFYEKAIKIQQESLPPNHPDMSVSYNNIGGVYHGMANYPKALSYFERALAIQQESLPSNHPDLRIPCSNIGSVYESMKNYSKARSFYQRAADIGQQLLPANHHDLQDYKRNLERVKRKL